VWPLTVVLFPGWSRLSSVARSRSAPGAGGGEETTWWSIPLANAALIWMVRVERRTHCVTAGLVSALVRAMLETGGSAFGSLTMTSAPVQAVRGARHSYCFQEIQITRESQCSVNHGGSVLVLRVVHASSCFMPRCMKAMSLRMISALCSTYARRCRSSAILLAAALQASSGVNSAQKPNLVPWTHALRCQCFLRVRMRCTHTCPEALLSRTAHPMSRKTAAVVSSTTAAQVTPCPSATSLRHGCCAAACARSSGKDAYASQAVDSESRVACRADS
jgi:hypothetical protein